MENTLDQIISSDDTAEQIQLVEGTPIVQYRSMSQELSNQIEDQSPTPTISSAEELLKAFEEHSVTEEDSILLGKPNLHISEQKYTVHGDKIEQKSDDLQSNPKVGELINKFSKPKNVKADKPKIPKSKPYAPPVRQATPYLEKAFKGTSLAKEVDGVDHINISDWGATPLGRFLDINAYAPFFHPELGGFESVGGLWYFVKCSDDADCFRYLYGGECRREAKQHSMRTVDGFRIIIADATWIKVNMNEHAIDDLIKSTLPFKNYFYFGEFNQKKSTPEAIWYCAVIDEIRSTLKRIKETENKNLLPDFSFLENLNFK